MRFKPHLAPIFAKAKKEDSFFNESLVAEMGFFIALTSRIVEDFACGYSARFLLALSPSRRLNRHLEALTSLTHSLRPEGHGRTKHSFETKRKELKPPLGDLSSFGCGDGI